MEASLMNAVDPPVPSPLLKLEVLPLGGSLRVAGAVLHHLLLRRGMSPEDPVVAPAAVPVAVHDHIAGSLGLIHSDIDLTSINTV